VIEIGGFLRKFTTFLSFDKTSMKPYHCPYCDHGYDGIEGEPTITLLQTEQYGMLVVHNCENSPWPSCKIILSDITQSGKGETTGDDQLPPSASQVAKK
jgi:hypothetical protein